MIFPGSRYATMVTYTVRQASGAIVTVTRLPLPGPAVILGYVRRGQGQRLDLIANTFLADSTAFWQLCDANNAVVPDALANQDLVGIPLNATPQI
jgi:hypothetical protein